MSTASFHEVLHYLSDADSDLVEEVLAAIDRWQRRTEGHITSGRRAHRFAYSTVVTVRTIVGIRARDKEEEFREVCFPVYARNLSQSGIGIVVAPRYLPQLMADDSILLRGEDLVAVKKPVEIGLRAANGEIRWVVGTVVRRRAVQYGFLDCGVAFEA